MSAEKSPPAVHALDDVAEFAKRVGIGDFKELPAELEHQLLGAAPDIVSAIMRLPGTKRAAAAANYAFDSNIESPVKEQGSPRVMRADAAVLEPPRALAVPRHYMPPSHRRVHAFFSLVELVVPPRISREEIGDALELIAVRNLTGWRLYLKAGSTTFWVLLNAMRHIICSVKGNDPSPS